MGDAAWMLASGARARHRRALRGGFGGTTRDQAADAMRFFLAFFATASALVTPPVARSDVAAPVIGRRAAVLGGVAAAFAGRAASAANPNEIQSILERAEKGTLRATPVISRARTDRLINAKDVNTCKQLSSLIETDSEVLYEVVPAARSYIKSKGEESGDDNRKLLKNMLEDAEIVQKRISKQLEALAEERSARQCP